MCGPYHGVKTSAVIVRCNEHVVGAASPVPKRELRRNEMDGGGEELSRVADGGEAVGRAEIAGHVNGDEEEIRFIRIVRPYAAGEQGPVNRHLGCEEVAAAPVVGDPVSVESRRQVVHVNLQILRQPT